MEELQVALKRQLACIENDAVGGWKVGMTSGAMRDVAGKGVRPFGHIRADRIFESGVELELGMLGSIGIETELCFEFGCDVARVANDEEIRAAIAVARPAFELNQRRLSEDASLFDRIEDNLSQWGVVIGEPVEDWRAIDYRNVAVRLSCDGKEVDKVDARGHIDDHFVSLSRLVRLLSEHDMEIRRGHHVITGSFNRTRVVNKSWYVGDFGDQLGSVEVSFA